MISLEARSREGDGMRNSRVKTELSAFQAEVDHEQPKW